MEIHSGQRPVKCELCLTTCDREAKLQLHDRGIQTDKRPMNCKTCGEALRQGDSSSGEGSVVWVEKVQVQEQVVAGIGLSYGIGRAEHPTNCETWAHPNLEARGESVKRGRGGQVERW